MVKVTWTDQSLEDLDAICLFIARDFLEYAKLFAIRVLEATDRDSYSSSWSKTS